jgi:predicted RNA-binding Zn-ribbon protein involved in translation (DUF1610 family)
MELPLRRTPTEERHRMKRIELQSALKRQQALSSGKNVFVFLSIYLPGMLAFPFLLAYVKDNQPYELLGIFAFLGYLIGCPLLWLKLKGVKRIKIRCHSCESKLNIYQIHIVMASKHCPICGERIIDKEDEERDQ